MNIVKYFVELGVDIHYDHDAVLQWSAYNSHLEVVKYLISVGANIHANNNAALRWSVDELEVFEYLVSVGANIHVNDNQLFDIKIIKDNFGHLL